VVDRRDQFLGHVEAGLLAGGRNDFTDRVRIAEAVAGRAEAVFQRHAGKALAAAGLVVRDDVVDALVTRVALRRLVDGAVLQQRRQADLGAAVIDPGAAVGGHVVGQGRRRCVLARKPGRCAAAAVGGRIVPAACRQCPGSDAGSDEAPCPMRFVHLVTPYSCRRRAKEPHSRRIRGTVTPARHFTQAHVEWAIPLIYQGPC
jgi:hypothetical protein